MWVGIYYHAKPAGKICSGKTRRGEVMELNKTCHKPAPSVRHLCLKLSLFIAAYKYCELLETVGAAYLDVVAP